MTLLAALIVLAPGLPVPYLEGLAADIGRECIGSPVPDCELVLASILYGESRFRTRPRRGHGCGIAQTVPRKSERSCRDNPGHWRCSRPTCAALESRATGVEWGHRVLAAWMARCNGNLRCALTRYNGSHLRHSYARLVLARCQKLGGCNSRLTRRALDSINQAER